MATSQPSNFKSQAQQLADDWRNNPRWKGIERPYTPEDVVRLRGSVQPEYTLARRGAEKLWKLLHDNDYINCLGALTGGQAVQQVKAGVRAIYLSGWQVAADNNTSDTMYPDQSLYPVDSVPQIVRRINNAFQRADQIQWANQAETGDPQIDFFAPIVADAEAGFGGVLNAHELMRGMIAAGAAGVHYEDQLAAVKKCGHMGGKVLVPTKEAIQKLIAARLAADLCNVPTVLLARTDANAATLLTSDCDPEDQRFVTGERTNEGFYVVKSGLDQAIARGLSYAPYADLLWCETSTPSIDEARRFADEIHQQFPNQMLAYNCSPSFNWKANLSDSEIASFQKDLAVLGYKYQFITLAGVHSMWHGMFSLSHNYVQNGMTAYASLQEKEFADADKGYSFVSHQQEVGAGYFDQLTTLIQGGQSSVTALSGSTEEEQF
ncbi:MAG: isocitrate lyase [Gammaproteobacteria bacterium]